jgi:hypothetical protein
MLRLELGRRQFFATATLCGEPVGFQGIHATDNGGTEVRRYARVVIWGGLALAWPAWAQDVSAPPPQVETERPASPEVFRDLSRLEALLPAFAAQARTERLVVGSVFIATGLAAVPIGIVAQASWHQDYGIGLWVSGALFLGFGTLSLLWQTPLETLAYDFQATAGRLAPAERLAFGAGGLASVAAGARSGRKLGAVIDFLLAGLFYGIAIGELVSASNSSGSDRTDDQSGAATSFIFAGLLTGAGVVQLVLPSPAETAYAVYASGASPSAGGVHLSGGVAPVHGGAVVGLGGTF